MAPLNPIFWGAHRSVEYWHRGPAKSCGHWHMLKKQVPPFIHDVVHEAGIIQMKYRWNRFDCSQILHPWLVILSGWPSSWVRVSTTVTPSPKISKIIKKYFYTSLNFVSTINTFRQRRWLECSLCVFAFVDWSWLPVKLDAVRAFEWTTQFCLRSEAIEASIESSFLEWTLFSRVLALSSRKVFGTLTFVWSDAFTAV